MRLSISHETTYHYEDQVRASIQYLRLTPTTASASMYSVGSSTCRVRCVRNSIRSATSCTC